MTLADTTPTVKVAPASAAEPPPTGAAGAAGGTTPGRSPAYDFLDGYIDANDAYIIANAANVPNVQADARTKQTPAYVPPQVAPNAPKDAPPARPGIDADQMAQLATIAEDARHRVNVLETFFDLSGFTSEDATRKAEAAITGDVIRKIAALGIHLPTAAGPPVAIPYATFIASAEATVPWFLQGVIVEGGITLLIGHPDAFKSMAALELAFSSAAGHRWLGFDVLPRPIVYISNEKSRATIADRLRHLAIIHPPIQPIVIAHRVGIKFGNPKWDQTVAQVADLDRPFVILDTLASLSPDDFNENSTQEMNSVLGKIRAITDTGATVLLAHHPKKTGKDGTPAALSGRGAGNLDGEIDGWIEARRPDPNEERITLYARPKDGTSQRIPLIWNRDTFGFDRDTLARICTSTTVAEVVTDEWGGIGLTGDQVATFFTGHTRTRVGNMLTEAKTAGLLRSFFVKGTKAPLYAPAAVSGPDMNDAWGTDPTTAAA
jgi:hypothetical protein